MYFFTPVDVPYYEKPHTELVYYHEYGSSSETDSEGMTNDRSSCWMISVIQALRASPAFRELYAPRSGDKNPLKKELFTLFHIAEGKMGHKRRPVREEETREFKKLLISEGLPVKMDRGFLEEPFLQFLLKKFDAKPIVYSYSSSSKKKRERIMCIPLISTKERQDLQALVKTRKIAFESKKSVPTFLPIYLDRPLERRYYDKHDQPKEAVRTPVNPSPTLTIPIGSRSGKMAHFTLRSIVIGRDSIDHAYSYVREKDAWVEYNDSRVIIHKEPETKKRRKRSHLTPLEDACKHAGIFIYERT